MPLYLLNKIFLPKTFHVDTFNFVWAMSRQKEEKGNLQKCARESTVPQLLWTEIMHSKFYRAWSVQHVFLESMILIHFNLFNEIYLSLHFNLLTKLASGLIIKWKCTKDSYSSNYKFKGRFFIYSTVIIFCRKPKHFSSCTLDLYQIYKVLRVVTP
jgi:hypothetical protein